MLPVALDKILPHKISGALQRLNSDKLYELRIRSGKAVSVGYGSGYCYLAPHGVSAACASAIVASQEDVNEVIMRACEKSLYAVNDKVCGGYITLSGGVRMGIAGETVFDGASIKTVKNFTAVDLRVPHEVKGCAEKAMSYIRNGCGYFSTLVISPPGAGKTTLLRDMARLAASAAPICNVLIADERDEIAAVSCGKATLDVGVNSDVISSCTKGYAFLSAIRALRPDVIVTDELCGAEDLLAVENATASGVTVFASVHAADHASLIDKPDWKKVIENKCFHRYIDLSSQGGPGTLEGVYDKDFRRLNL